jgi:hypothetical protein
MDNGKRERRRAQRYVGLIAAVFLFVPMSVRAQTQPTGLTVLQEVETEYYVDPQAGLPIAGASAWGDLFPFSPGGRRTFYVTRRADVASDRTIFTLHLVEQSAQGATPVERPIASMASPSNRPGIWQARWIDEAHIGFIGENDDSGPQVYTVDLAGQVQEHTTGADDKSGFAIAGSTILYGELPAIGMSAADRNNGYVIGDRPLADVLGLSAVEWRRRVHYRATVDGRQIDLGQLQGPYSMIAPFMSVSPSGRYAVIATAPTRIPDRWTGMAYFMPSPAGAAPRSHHQELTLIDLRDGTSHTLTGGPFAQPTNPVQLVWDEDRARLFALDQFIAEGSGLPNPAHDRPWVVEYSLETYRLTSVVGSGPAPKTLVGDDLVLNARMRGSDLEITRRAGTTRYRWTNGIWKASVLPQPDAAPAFLLGIDQALDRQPQLVVRQSQNETPQPIGPLLNAATRSEMLPGRLYEWTDRFGKPWQGNLILPSGGTEAGGLPLVIETHTFRPDEFIVTGPFGASAGFSAQALAHAGFAVLVMGYRDREQYGPHEFEIAAEGYRSAIEDLVQKGLVDRARVGAMAWSRSGFWLQYALSEYPDMFAAASVSDGSSFGEFQYLFFENWPGYQDDYLTRNGTSPFGAGREQWTERDPVSRVPSFATPLRIEKYGAWPSWWEPYTAMRSNDQPVEYFHIPTASHDPRIPRHQLVIQSQTVDWFSFWLLGRKNPSPLLEDQYERWDRLCRLRANRLAPAPTRTSPCSQGSMR